MADEPNKGGHPVVWTDEVLRTVVAQITPYLRNGLSVKKSCLIAGIVYQTVYDKMKEVEWFRDQIEAEQSFKSKLFSNIVTAQLINLSKRFEDNPAYTPTKDEMVLMQFLATQDKAIRDEFGAHTEVTGKEGEPLIPPMLDNPDVVKTLLKQFDIIRAKTVAEPAATSQPADVSVPATSSEHQS